MNPAMRHYLALPYTRRVRLEVDEDGTEYFVAYIEELDGLEADGVDATEALANLQGAFEDYLAAMLEWNHEIPEPDVWPGRDYVAPVQPLPARATGQPLVASSWDELEKAGASSAGRLERDLEYA